MTTDAKLPMWLQTIRSDTVHKSRRGAAYQQFMNMAELEWTKLLHNMEEQGLMDALEAGAFKQAARDRATRAQKKAEKKTPLTITHMFTRREQGLCPLCGLTVEPKSFRDELSRKEYRISGMCQKCQDDVFQDPDKEPANKAKEFKTELENDEAGGAYDPTEGVSDDATSENPRTLALDYAGIDERDMKKD
jgi:hypothetical protein